MARYRIVPESSQVWIDARSSLHPIHSRTDGLEGYLNVALDGDGAVSAGEDAGRVTLPVSRLKSGNRMEDRELQKRIDARRHPTIDGTLVDMTPADGNGRYRVGGDISFRGVVRRHHGEMTVAAETGGALRLAGASRFDIRQFGMEPPRVLMLKVEPEVDVRVEILAVPEG